MSLHKRCHDGDLKSVRKYVQQLKEGELAEKLGRLKGLFGYTPLHEAVAGGHHKIVEFLLENGAHINCRANRGYTPLHLAAKNGHEECVKVLLNHGADISLMDDNGKTPRQTAERSSKRIVRLLHSEGESCAYYTQTWAVRHHDTTDTYSRPIL